MKKIPLKSKELNKKLGLDLNKKDQVILADNKIILINDYPSFFYYEDKIVPTLKYLQTNDYLKKITVDMGAIKFIINGADIMRPGITEIEDKINQDDFVVVIDTNNHKPLAVCIALLDSEEMRKTESGKVLKNIHYVGDEIWNFK